MREDSAHLPDAKSIGVVGLGFVGLPLARAFAEAGISVVGVDTDRNRIATLNRGQSYIEDVPAASLQPLVTAGKLHPTDTYEALQEVEATIICLPTPLNEYREPDLSIAMAGAEAVARNSRPGALIVLESTTYPGTTREVLLPFFERSGRRVGRDFLPSLLAGASGPREPYVHHREHTSGRRRYNRGVRSAGRKTVQ